MPETLIKKIELRRPVAEDGMAVFKLIQQCPPLDTNSIYCNLLQCGHFAGTSVAASSGGELVGFISGYMPPERVDTLFIWQVAASEPARGQGLATRMLMHILNRPQCRKITYLETTITEANAASWALFSGLAGRLQAGIESAVEFDRDRHFAGEHETEMLVRIGPIAEAELLNSASA